MSNPLVIIAMLFALLALVCLVATAVALKKGKLFGASMKFISTLLMLSLAALFGTISISLQGYQALTKEELAAVVNIKPTGVQKFTARFTFPDKSERVFALAGDQLYVDAHILKWKPIANICGLHTDYELDRVEGRYENLNEETSKIRTVYALSKDKLVDMFYLRRRFEILKPLVDAEYGSATFINSNRAEEFEVMVSTTGLLIRTTEKDTE
ncbi:MAG TPA: hypothetical protein VEI57_11330 [Nitrospirota bacterium]|nr:hypothetical protein [Nitrospirota bacterium]